jgi:hypothetical protein
MIATLGNVKPPKRLWRMKTQARLPGDIAGVIYSSAG